MKLQQPVVSDTDSRTVKFPSDEMHMRSLKASVVPWAQQEPQSDWSRMWPITLAHFGNAVRASKSVGVSMYCSNIDSSFTGSRIWVSSLMPKVFLKLSTLRSFGAAV